MNYFYSHTTLLGTTTGTVLTVAVNISSQDYFKTAILAALGAMVSFFVSLFLKWLIKQLRK